MAAQYRRRRPTSKEQIGVGRGDAEATFEYHLLNGIQGS